MRYSNEELEEYFDTEAIAYNVENVASSFGNIRCIKTGKSPSDDSLTTIVFIHGAPGSSDAFYSYLTDRSLVDKAQLISVDRPGYGYSNYGEALVGIMDQVNSIAAVIDKMASKKLILMSHSYGCPIAGMLSIKYADRVSANMMICPVIHPDFEKVFFFSSWPSLPLLKHFFSKAMQVSSFEKMTHEHELKGIEKEWQKTSVPTIVMHGEKDWIAPVENATYLEDKVAEEYLTVDLDESESHFILWTKQQKIVDIILTFL